MKPNIKFETRRVLVKNTIEFTAKELEMLYAITGSIMGKNALRDFTDSLYTELSKHFGDCTVCQKFINKFGITNCLHVN